MKLTLTIEATPEDMKHIKNDIQGFAKEVEGMLKRHRVMTPVIDIKSSGFSTPKWKI